MKITICHLYGDLMNIYGDTGNIIALKKRCQWRGIEVEIKNILVGQKLPPRGWDLFFFGGGQDQAQELVAKDLTKGNGKIIKNEVERGVPLLAICGGYQLLGGYYQPHKGSKIQGIGIFPVYTVASCERMVGNLVILHQISDIRYPHLVGFENHSGKTYLKEGAKPLGKVIKGFGNNGEDVTEGCIYKNAIGCYMHGSLLPKNPQLTDWLIKKALEVKYGKGIDLDPLDDSLEEKAHQKALQKFG